MYISEILGDYARFAPKQEQEPVAPVETTTEVEDMGVVEQSTGFHVLEIHAPTVGFGFFGLVMFIVMGFICYSLYRCIRTRLGVNRLAPATMPFNVAAFHPRQHPQIMFVDPRISRGQFSPRMMDEDSQELGRQGDRRTTVLGDM